jgi:hypothetical protein
VIIKLPKKSTFVRFHFCRSAHLNLKRVARLEEAQGGRTSGTGATEHGLGKAKIASNCFMVQSIKSTMKRVRNAAAISTNEIWSNRDLWRSRAFGCDGLCETGRGRYSQSVRWNVAKTSRFGPEVVRRSRNCIVGRQP